MDISRNGEGFCVAGSKGTKYNVNLKKNTCTCPHFRFRLRGQGECKHIRACKEHSTGGGQDYDEIVGYVRDNVFVEAIELIEKFGEEAVDEMVRQGELVEEGGKVRLL